MRPIASASAAVAWRTVATHVALLRLAYQVVPRPPPAGQAGVIAASLACDGEDVAMGRLTEALMRPDGDRVVSVEVAEDPSARLVRAVEPGALSAPGERVALATVALRLRTLPQFALVCGGERRSVGVGRDLPPVRHPTGGQAQRGLERVRICDRLEPAVLPELGGHDCIQSRIGCEGLGRRRHRKRAPG